MVAVIVSLVSVAAQGEEGATSIQPAPNLTSITHSAVQLSGDGVNSCPELVGVKPRPWLGNDLIGDDLSEVETRDALILELSFIPCCSASEQATTIHRYEVVEDRSDPVIQARRHLPVTPMVGR